MHLCRSAYVLFQAIGQPTVVRQISSLQCKHGKIVPMTAKLILRNREYEVKSGQTLRSALKEAGILPESVIATRQGEMITEDEMVREGDVIKLIAVISGGIEEGR